MKSESSLETLENIGTKRREKSVKLQKMRRQAVEVEGREREREREREERYREGG